jgi:hypothetical protein
VRPAATAAAPPPLEPPGVRFRSQGLLVRPKIGLSVCASALRSGTLVLPITIAPAARRRATGVATGGAQPRGLEGVLDGDRDAVESTPHDAARQRLVRRASTVEGFRSHGHDGVEGRVERVDASEKRRQEFAGTDLVFPDCTDESGRAAVKDFHVPLRAGLCTLNDTRG